MDDVNAFNDPDLFYKDFTLDLDLYSGVQSDVRSTILSPLINSWHQQDSISEICAGHTLAILDAVEDVTWRRKHPVDWSSFDVLDWIFSIDVLQEDLGMLRGERFREIDGRELCRMTLPEFLEKDPLYGRQLYDSLNDLLLQLRLFVPTKDAESTLWTSSLPLFPDALSDFDDEFDDDVYSRNVMELLDEESFGKLPSISTLFRGGGESAGRIRCAADETTGLSSASNDSTMFTSDQNEFVSFSLQNLSDHGYHSGESSPDSSTSGSPFHPFSYGELPTIVQSINDLDLPETEVTTEVDYVLPSAHAPAPVQKRRPGRPRKRDAGIDGLSSSEGEISKQKTGNRSKAVHLWEFMRSLLDDPVYNPESIKWENKEDGVFRIVPGQSKVIAQLWGQRKNNPSMTFDKLSRSLRWCRTFGFLSEVPKNGMYPKKLCFRFGDRASLWDRS